MNDVTPPQAARPYFDKVQIWLEQAIGNTEINALEKMCGQGGIYHENRPARFSSRFRQRIELRQPTDAALSGLGNYGRGLVNRLEVSIDYIFSSVEQCDAAFAFLHFHLVRRWHGQCQMVKLVGAGGRVVCEIGLDETRYDAGRAANKTVFYRTAASRITDEPHCLHFEWHLNGARAVAAAGIGSPADLAKFDHRSFWHARLLLQEVVAAECLGRIVRNWRDRTKSRAKKNGVTDGGNTVDEKAGYLLLRASGSIQELKDRLRDCGRIGRALQTIDNGPWLP
jgi:hypothetical protein